MLKYYKYYNKNVEDHNKLVKQIIKISLPNLDIETVFKIFNGKKDYLSDHLIYFYDVDFTKDISGAFIKENLIKIMMNHGFYIESYNCETYENEDMCYSYSNLQNGEGIIMKNNKTVGKHCLSFLYNFYGNIVRAKFYNKFIDNLEVASLDSKVGSNLKNWHTMIKTFD